MSTKMPGGHKRSPEIEGEYVQSNRRGRSFTSKTSIGYESLSNGSVNASSSNLNHQSGSNISPGSINGSTDNLSTRAPSAAATGKVHKAFGNFGGKLQNIVQSIAASSPKVHRRSQSADGRRRGHRSVDGANSNNEGLDLSVPFGSRVPAGDVSKANISAVFSRDARHQPGAVGIHNHGNTCFMNAVVQCLSNTEYLLEYFLSGDYQRLPFGRQPTGTNGNVPTGLANGARARNLFQNGVRVGALTERFAKLLKSIWSCRYRPEISCGFKAIVGEYGSQYEGTCQNDSQEFLLWLLDKLHDDCANRIPTIAANSSNQARASSIIYDLFQARYRSTLTCPNCQQQSKTYDPFLSLSLPIQQKFRIPVFVTIVRLSLSQLWIYRIGLLFNSGDLIIDLRRAIAERDGIPFDQMVLLSMQHHTFYATFHDADSIADIQEAGNIYAVETRRMPEDVGPDAQILTSKYISIVALNNTYNASHRKRVGDPFVIQVSRDSTITQLQTSLLRGMKTMIKEATFQQALTSFHIKVLDGTLEGSYLQPNDELPLYALCVDQALSLCGEGDGPPHIKLVLEWPYRLYKCYVINTSADSVVVDKSVKYVKAECHQTNIGKLEDCFQVFTQQERLGSEDTWFCPNCRKSQQGTIKTLSLCSLPDVLVIHLKRFRQDGDNRTKLNTLISFPVSNLDMSSHVRPESTSSSETDRTEEARDDCLYDLYAVCNHIGNMQEGHYTAFCKNALSGRWYTFDDAKVTELRSIDSIVTKHAYLLFYQRHTACTRASTLLHQWVAQEFNVVSAMTPSTTSHDTTLQDTDHSLDDALSVQSHADITGQAPKVKPSVPSARSSLRRSTESTTQQHSFKVPSKKSGGGIPHSRSATDYLAASTPVFPRSHNSMHSLPGHAKSHASLSATQPTRHNESMRAYRPTEAQLRAEPVIRHGPAQRSSRDYGWTGSNSLRGYADQSGSHLPKSRVPLGSVGAPYCNEAYQQASLLASLHAIKVTDPNDLRSPSRIQSPPVKFEAPPKLSPPTKQSPTNDPNKVPDGIRKLVPSSRRNTAPSSRNNNPKSRDCLWDDGSFLSLPADVQSLTSSMNSVDFTAAMRTGSSASVVVVTEKQLSGGRVRVKRDDSNSTPMTTYQYITNGSTLQESSV